MIFIVLLLPAIQQFANFPRVSPLKGAVTFPKMPNLNLKGYFNASLQDSMDKWVENHVGFRPDLVRLHNQIQYSLFDTISARGVIFGKDNYLFEYNYIKALYGLNFVGYDKITKDAEETRFVNDWPIRCLAWGSYYDAKRGTGVPGDSWGGVYGCCTRRICT
jgi:hypothetical protein